MLAPKPGIKRIKQKKRVKLRSVRSSSYLGGSSRSSRSSRSVSARIDPCCQDGFDDVDGLKEYVPLNLPPLKITDSKQFFDISVLDEGVMNRQKFSMAINRSVTIYFKK